MSYIHSVLKIFSILALLSVAACSSTPPAPVIDRLPSDKPEATTSTSIKKPITNRPSYKTGDWRPETYTVKKGDTLFSIGLEYGYDYKEIAEYNQINPPYPIKIGQVLKLKQNNTASNVTPIETNADGVTTVPFGDEGSPTPSKTVEGTSTSTSSVILIQSPKASRVPYSDEAFNKPVPTVQVPITKTPPPIPASPVEEKSIVKPATEPSTDTATKYETAESVDWSWPSNGKVVAWFNESTNKGLDIAGKVGQPVLAAAAGKVIYSGSDLRSYGKLVIIKHNPLYLSVYAHNSLIVVKEGQLVNRGQKIAEMGNSESTSVKLHFEIRRQGKSVDPKLYLPAN